MQKRHYEAIAKLIGEHTNEDSTLDAHFVRDLTNYLATDNPAFNFQSFLNAIYKARYVSV